MYLTDWSLMRGVGLSAVDSKHVDVCDLRVAVYIPTLVYIDIFGLVGWGGLVCLNNPRVVAWLV